MGVGHVAVALGASRAAPRVNVGWLVFAALLADFLLGIFASLGLECATVPENYSAKHYLLFTFPYSHGLAALFVWAMLFGLLISRWHQVAERSRVWLVIALVVLSHFVLDGIVHIAGLPLIGQTSPKLGLGLWKLMPFELALETFMAIAGLALYWKLASPSKFAWRRYGMTSFVAVVTLMTWTQLRVTVPPDPKQLTGAWIIVPLVFGAVAYGLDRKRTRQVRVS